VECDEVLIAVGQENAFPWIERDIGLQFDDWDMPLVDRKTMQSTLPNVFFGGDAAFGPKNIITAVAHGHEAAVSIDRFCHNEDVKLRPLPSVTMASQKMGIHEWSFDNVVSLDHRFKVPLEDFSVARKSIKIEVERGFTPQMAAKEAQRCLNCDVQSVFTASRCIECDACLDICPMDCLTVTDDGEEAELRSRMKAPSLHPKQPLYVSAHLKTGRVMVKDEDLCLHCSLCAERCPTGAWDMQKFTLQTTHAGPAARDQQPKQTSKTA
jgi:formate dehydrogenase (NADP+) beta subunit